MTGWFGDDSHPRHRKPAASGRGARRTFGMTWWGRAWVDALTYDAGLDPGRLSRGRSYARAGAVERLDVVPGALRALVQGSRRTPYETTVEVPVLSDAGWDAVIDAIAAAAGRAAALLDGVLPQEVVSDVAAAGERLLPVAGELDFDCSCPDWGDPCKHAAAVCFAMADAVDEDPFALLLLRGRTRTELVAELRARRAKAAGATRRGRGRRERVPTATTLFRRTPADLPAPAPTPVGGAPLGDWAPAPAAITAAVAHLRLLAADAAARAAAVLADEQPARLSTEADLARWAATDVGDLLLAARVPANRRTVLAAAWRAGGAEGVAVLDERWEPADDDLEPGVAALGPVGVRVEGNRATRGTRQLRLAPSGRWHPYRRTKDGWVPAGRADADPIAALGTLDP